MNNVRRVARRVSLAIQMTLVGVLAVLIPATPAMAADEVSATVKQVSCNPDGTATVYWNLHNTFNGEARFDILRATQGTLQFTTPPKTYQGNVKYIVLDGGATMVVYVTLLVPSPTVSLDTDFYWPTGPAAGFSVTGNPPVQLPANCPKVTNPPTTRGSTAKPSGSASPKASVEPTAATPSASSSAGAVDGFVLSTPAPELERRSAAAGRDRTRGAVVALVVGLCTLALLGGWVWVVVRRRRVAT